MAPPQSWKGKRRAHSPTRNGQSSDRPIPPAAYIQAYEAQLVYDRVEVAQELSTPVDDLPESSRARGRGLLRWQGDTDRNVWADRHDIIHLLDALPPSLARASRSPSPSESSSSWDSLPSDAEETFNLSDSEEYDNYERQKRTKWIAALREERLREREKQDRADPSLPASEMPDWANDEEVSWDQISSEPAIDAQPPDAILTLMRHTAKSLLSSPNPQVLEMRILAHHAKDERFAFLRGRYKAAWQSLKDQNRRKKMNDPVKKQKEEKAVGALLGAYESSEEEEEEEGNTDDEDAAPLPPSSPPPPPPDEGDGPPVGFAPSPPPSLPVEEPKEVSPVTADEGGSAPKAIGGQDEVNEAETQRLRRLKLEEWKRKRAEGLKQ